MIVLYAKIGTGPATFVRVKSKLKEPKVGDRFDGIECDTIAGKIPICPKWEGFLLTDIKGPNEFLTQRVFYLERF